MRSAYTPTRSTHLKGFCRKALAAFVLCGCLAQLLPLTLHAATVPEEAMLTDEHYALDTFTSPLPLLVLDVPMDEAPTDANGFFLEVGVESHDGQQANTLGGTPTLAVQGVLRNMTDRLKAEGTAHKNDYYLRLNEQQGLLGLAASSEFLLLGGARDKSLIRNYLGYTLAAQLMGSASNSQLCEVFFSTDDGALYQGVYLLVQLQVLENGMLFHRNTSGESITITTFSTENDPGAGHISIPFMEATEWDERYSEQIGRLSEAESVLYSEDAATFYEYTEHFDVSSFIAAFILGELTENYTGMTDAYYYYDLDSFVLSAAPIWNFDEAFDNIANDAVDAGRIRYHEAPYYVEFLKSPSFADEVQSTYLRARNAALSESALERLVSAGAALVAPAVARDWSRWDDYSAHTLQPLTEVTLDDETTQAVEPVSRQSATHGEALLRIKNQLRQHNLSMAVNLTQFDFNEREISKEIVLNANPFWLILFLAVFFALVRFARRYGV